MSNRPIRLAVLTLIAGALTAPTAAADTLTLQFTGATPGATPLSYSYNGSAGSTTPGPYFWNQLAPPNGGSNPVTTFCIELTQGIQSGSVQFNVVSLDTAPTIGTPAKADAIASLFGYYYNSAWNNPATANSDPSYREFQLALWEIMTDGAVSAPNRFATGSGNFTSSDPAAANAQLLLNTALGDVSQGLSLLSSRFPGTQLVALTSDFTQDQLIFVPQPKIVDGAVPAPPGVVLAGIGLACCLLGRVRRRTVAAA